jgi:predicted acylesterase/phospholipase RssA
MVIKHLVLSGGGPSGFHTYGAVKYLSINNFWNISNIETIYGTSIGACIGIILCLKYEWEVIDDYFIKRPWNKIINISPDSVLELWNAKGLLGRDVIFEIIAPLLKAKELSTDITLKEFYEYTNIELHMFTVNVNCKQFTVVDLSYKTHPDLQLVTALYMSCAIPFIFKPVIIDDCCYIDGAVKINFPVERCLKSTNCNEDEVLVFKNVWEITPTNFYVNDNTTLFQYWACLTRLLLKESSTENEQPDLPNTVKCIIDNFNTYDDWLGSLNNKEIRLSSIKKGEKSGVIFNESKTK